MAGWAQKRDSTVSFELGHYRVVEKIGEGGMGEVFRAHDEHLGRDVALKILPQGVLVDDHARHLFRKEAAALSRLNHPNIVTVHDFDTQQDQDFLVMEYVPGPGLNEKLLCGPLSEREVVRIGVQLAEGLAAAHKQGVIHGDLKPGNLKLTHDERLKILDFGLARSMSRVNPQATTESSLGTVGFGGTLAYMPPEQLRGVAVDVRSDIYSAGVVLYELATAHPPFSQELSAPLIDDILHKPPTAPARVQAGISRRLEEIILRCLEKEPEKRFQSAEALLAALQELANLLRLAQPRTAAKRRRKYGLYALAGCLAAALVTVALWTVNHRGGTMAGGTPHIEALAVLPLANLSGDPQQDYLADGITDLLITDLGQMHSFQRVISRTSVMRYKTERTPLKEIARQLNVDGVIEGSVLRAEGAIQVTVRLVNGSDETQLWSHTYQSEFRDLLNLQRELALAIAEEIKLNVSAGERSRLPRTPSVEPAAQEAYLKGSYLSTGTSEQRAKARQYFEQAVQLDPDFALAYAGLADTYWKNLDFPASIAMPKAKEYALKAIALDGSLARAHTALASVRFYGDWDWPGAEREFQQALDLNPTDAEAHRMYSLYLAAMGRFDPAIVQIQTAQRLDPLAVSNSTAAGWILYFARRYDQGAAQCQRALELAPNNDNSHACLSHIYLGKGAYQQAIEESQKAWSLSGGDTVRAVLLGQAYAAAGDKTESRRMLDQLLERSGQTYMPPYFLATLFVALGDKEMGFRWLEKAQSERDFYLAWIKVDPALDPLRSDARFKELLGRMGL